MNETEVDATDESRVAQSIAEIDGLLLDAQTLKDDAPDDRKTADWKAYARRFVRGSAFKDVDEETQTTTVRELCVRLHGRRAQLAVGLHKMDRANVVRIAEADAFREVLRSHLVRLVGGAGVATVLLSIVFAFTGVIQLRDVKVDTRADMRAVYDEYNKTTQDAKRAIADDKSTFNSEMRAAEEKIRNQREQLERQLVEAEKRLSQLDDEVGKLVREHADQHWRPQIEGAVSDEKAKIGLKVGDLVSSLKPSISQAWEQERENFGERKERLTNLEARSKERLDALAKEHHELREALRASEKAQEQRGQDIAARLERAGAEVSGLEAILALKRMGGERELAWILQFWWWGVAALAFSALVSLVLSWILVREQIASLRASRRNRSA